MNPLVSIICFCYNHEQFVEKALKSIISQNTDFEFEVIIHDDASTDSSQRIIESFKDNYPKILKPIFQKENQASQERGRVSKICYRSAKGKYIALCEGDDYWTDTFKLQKQVDFLEENNTYSLCFHRATVINEKGDSWQFKTNYKNEYNGKDLFSEWFIPTASVVFKNVTLDYDFLFGNIKGDLSLFLELAQYGKMKFINEDMSVYRKHEGGVMNTFKGFEFFQNQLDYFTKINERYKFKYQKEISIQQSDLCIALANTMSKENKSNAIQYLFKSFKYSRTQPFLNGMNTLKTAIKIVTPNFNL